MPNIKQEYRRLQRNLQMTIETPTQHKTMKHEGFTNFTNLEKTFLHHSNARSFLARCKVLEKKHL